MAEKAASGSGSASHKRDPASPLKVGPLLVLTIFQERISRRIRCLERSPIQAWGLVRICLAP